MAANYVAAYQRAIRERTTQPATQS